MIISDLSHFEEVVAEAPSIVGGTVTKKTTTITADQLLSDFVLDLLSPQSVALLKKTKVSVNSVTVKSKGAVATVKTGTAKAGNVKVSTAFASASA